MSETQEMPNSQLLIQLVQQRNAYAAQSEQLAIQFQQAQGAIMACNEMISKIEKDALEQIIKRDQEKLADKDNQGEKVDGKTNIKAAEQAAQK